MGENQMLIEYTIDGSEQLIQDGENDIIQV